MDCFDYYNMLIARGKRAMLCSRLYCILLMVVAITPNPPQVEAVKLECTGAQPRPLRTTASPRLALSTLKGPLCIEGKGLPEMEESVNSKTVLSSAALLAVTRSAPPMPRNVVLEYGDFAGERAVRGVLNCDESFGEGRLDPREAVDIERAATDKLQNPRLVSEPWYS